MRRQYDLHTKEPNKRTMNVPTTTASYRQQVNLLLDFLDAAPRS
jgi:hypothetical protein